MDTLLQGVTARAWSGKPGELVGKRKEEGNLGTMLCSFRITKLDVTIIASKQIMTEREMRSSFEAQTQPFTVIIFTASPRVKGD